MRNETAKRGIPRSLAGLAVAAILGGAECVNARELNHMRFRAQVFTQGENGVNIINVGYDPGGINVGQNVFADLQTVSVARSKASSLVKVYEGLGTDCYGIVYGKIIDTNGAPYNEGGGAAPAAGAGEYTLTAGEQAEFDFGQVDVLSPTMRRKISASNKPAANAVAGYGPDMLPNAAGGPAPAP